MSAADTVVPPPPAAAEPPETAVKTGGYLAAAGLATGLGAVVASSCCVLPVALAGLGAGAGVFAALEALAPLRWPLIALSMLAVAFAWWAYLCRRSIACAADGACAPRPRRSAVAIVLGLATLLLATAVAWEAVEPALLRIMRRGL